MSEELTQEQATEVLAKQMREMVRGPDERHSPEDEAAVVGMASQDPTSKYDASGYPRQVEEEQVAEAPVQEETEAVTEEVTEAPEAEEVTPERTKLSPEEMTDLYATGVVNGEEVEYSLDKLLAIAQTQDAASDRLDRSKTLEHELRAEIAKTKEMQNQLTQQPEPKPEFMTEQDEQIYNLNQELQSLKGNMVQADSQRLIAAEDAQIRAIAQEELGTQDMGKVAELIGRVQQEDPNFAAVTSDLFSRAPQDQGDMQRRLAMFRSTIAMGKGIEMPSIVRAAKAEGVQEGKKETMQKVKKETLTTVSATAPAPQVSEFDQLSKAQASPGIGGFVDVWKGRFG